MNFLTIRLHTTDYDQIQDINNDKASVALWLAFVYVFHYIFLVVLVFQKNNKRHRIQDLGRRLHIYGIAALISLNFVQTCMGFPMIAFSAFILLLISHVLCFIDQVKQRTRVIVLSVYYLFMMIWFSLILFFYVYNALQSV